MANRMEIKKALDLVNKLEETKTRLNQAFDVCPQIHEVAIALGATAVTPREIFVIQLPPLNPDADNLSTKACVKSLYRQLIVQDPLHALRDIKQISPTNISLLLYAPRQSDLHWFYPKPAYKLSVRSKQFKFCLRSKCGEGNHDLSTNLSIVDLSGFEPFDSFIDECEEVSSISTVQTTTNSSASSLSTDFVHIDSDHELEIVDVNVKDNNIDDTPIYCEDLSVANAKHGNGINKSGSASSILEQNSVMSTESRASADGSNCMRESNSDIDSCSGRDSCSGMVIGDEDETGNFSLTDTEYIWFQSPILIKGYRC